MVFPKEINEFLSSWEKDPLQTKDAFLEFMKLVKPEGNLTSKFVSRPGVSHSLRLLSGDSKIVSLIDVIDDDPENRWLSVCFFADMVSDPDELGDYVPAGLEGKDAICFNLDEKDEKIKNYIKDRLGESIANSHK